MDPCTRPRGEKQGPDRGVAPHQHVQDRFQRGVWVGRHGGAHSGGGTGWAAIIYEGGGFEQQRSCVHEPFSSSSSSSSSCCLDRAKRRNPVTLLQARLLSLCRLRVPRRTPLVHTLAHVSSSVSTPGELLPLSVDSSVYPISCPRFATKHHRHRHHHASPPFGNVCAPPAANAANANTNATSSVAPSTIDVGTRGCSRPTVGAPYPNVRRNPVRPLAVGPHMPHVASDSPMVWYRGRRRRRTMA